MPEEKSGTDHVLCSTKKRGLSPIFVKNKVFISSSIAELYIEVKNKQLAKYWIAKMKADLEGFPGHEYFQNLYLELQEMVN